MIYLLTEDSQSGPLFWNALLAEQTAAYKVISHRGCQDLLPNLKSMLREPSQQQPADSIYILAVDQANESAWEAIVDTLRKFQPTTPYFITNYLCIESALLLAIESLQILDVLNLHSDCYPAIQTFVRCHQRENFTEFWNAEINYELALQPFYQSVIYTRSLQISDGVAPIAIKYQGYTTLEQAVAGLLSRVTQGTGFKFTKGDVGKCWTEDCCWGVKEIGDQFTKPCTIAELLTQRDKADQIINSVGFNECISDINGNHMGLRDVINLAIKLESEAEGAERAEEFGITHEFV